MRVVHSIQYNTCGASKKDCDKKFLKDMQDKCRSYQPMLANPGFCLFLAYTYYQAVNWGGGSAYKDGQQMACSPCPILVPKRGPRVIVKPGHAGHLLLMCRSVIHSSLCTYEQIAAAPQ